MRARLGHLVSLAAYGVLVSVWLLPLTGRMAAAVPGSGPGDNLVFVWNLWWARHAVQQGTSLWRSSWLFAPFSVDLALNTHTALEGIVGALLDPYGSVVRPQNIWIAAHLFLNLACGYWLAWRLTRSAAAAFVGGIIFGGGRVPRGVLGRARRRVMRGVTGST